MHLKKTKQLKAKNVSLKKKSIFKSTQKNKRDKNN